MKAILQFTLLVALVASGTAYAVPCEPITTQHCTATQISAENCHDGSANDSRGAYYGALTLADGSKTCDAWHGYGDQYTYNAMSSGTYSCSDVNGGASCLPIGSTPVHEISCGGEALKYGSWVQCSASITVPVLNLIIKVSCYGEALYQPDGTVQTRIVCQEQP